MSSNIAKPPLLQNLPFENLEYHQFETFCKDLFRELYQNHETSLYGSKGHKQYGIDIIVTGKDERIGVQCKHHKDFTPNKVKEVVAKLLPEAKTTSCVLALSSIATPNARNTIDNYDNWKLWDQNDLSTKVRDLPKAKQIKLIDTHFPGLREKFLGYRYPSPWLTLAEFQQPFLQKSSYEQNFTFTARNNELNKLRKSVNDSSKSLIFVVGQGGIGKSRLLFELAKTATNREVRFVERYLITAEMFEFLPEGDPIIILDDAPEIDTNISSLAKSILRARPEATIILSVRPQALAVLQRSLDIIDDEENATIYVNEMPLAAAELLAQEALGQNSSTAGSELLAEIGYDCPLLIVLGAQILQKEKLSTKDIISRHWFRKEILTRFANVTVSGANNGIRPEILKEVLEALAVIQPAHLDKTAFKATIAKLSDQHKHKIFEIIVELENLGIVIKNGHSYRIVPDILGEAILEKALVINGLDTGFATFIAENAGGEALVNAIRNVSLIDYYRRLFGEESNLAEKLWEVAIASVINLSNSERKNMAKNLEYIAAVYPKFTLDLVEQILQTPAADEADPLSEVWGGKAFLTSKDCALSLTHLIYNAIYVAEPEHLERGMRLLFIIGKEDQRNQNNAHDHGINLLRQLVEYAPQRSLNYHELYVQFIKNWLSKKEFAADKAMLLSLLNPILELEVTITKWKGSTLSCGKRNVDLEAVAAIRNATIEVAGLCLSAELPAAIVAIGLLEKGLESPHKTDPVTVEFAKITELLSDLISVAKTHPSVRLSAYRAFAWHAQFGEGERKELARKIRRSLFIDTDFQAVRLIRGEHAVPYVEDDDESDETDFLVKYENSVKDYQKTVKEVISVWEKIPDEPLLQHLYKLMQEDSQATGKFCAPNDFLVQLFQTRITLAHKTISDMKAGNLFIKAMKQCALAAMFNLDDPLAEAAALNIIAEKNAKLVALAVAQVNDGEKLSQQRLNVAQKLLALGDPQAICQLLRCARRLNPADSEIIKNLILFAPIANDVQLAKEAASIIAHSHIINWGSFTPVERAQLLKKFSQCSRLPSYEFGKILNEQIKFDAINALNFLQNRIDMPLTGYEQILPNSWDKKLNFRASPNFSVVLQQLVEWLVARETQSRQHYCSMLFWQVAGEHDEEIFAIFLNLIRAKNTHSIRVLAYLLNQVERNFVVKEVGFVIEVIAAAQTLEPQLKDTVLAALHRSAMYGTSVRPIGVADPAEIELQQNAASLTKKYSTNLAVQEFYEKVVEFSKHRVSSQSRHDSDLEQPRIW